MITAGDVYANITPMELYDTGMMQLAITAAKDQYDKANEEMKEFAKEYNAFVSSAPGGTEAMYNETTGKMNRIIDDMYSKGLDPFRTKEGRAYLRRALNSVDYAKIGQIKSDATNYLKYVDAVNELKSKNLFSKDMNDFLLLRAGLADQNGNLTWRSGEGTPWTFMPSEYKSLENLTRDYVDNLEKTDLGNGVWGADRRPVMEQVLGKDGKPQLDENGKPIMRQKIDPLRRSFGVTDQGLNDAWLASRTALGETDAGEYQIYKADRTARLMKPGASEQEVAALRDQILKSEFMSAHADRLKIESKVDEVAKWQQEMNLKRQELNETKRYHLALENKNKNEQRPPILTAISDGLSNIKLRYNIPQKTATVPYVLKAEYAAFVKARGNGNEKGAAEHALRATRSPLPNRQLGKFMGDKEGRSVKLDLSDIQNLRTAEQLYETSTTGKPVYGVTTEVQKKIAAMLDKNEYNTMYANSDGYVYFAQDENGIIQPYTRITIPRKAGDVKQKGVNNKHEYGSVNLFWPSIKETGKSEYNADDAESDFTHDNSVYVPIRYQIAESFDETSGKSIFGTHQSNTVLRDDLLLLKDYRKTGDSFSEADATESAYGD